MRISYLKNIARKNLTMLSVKDYDCLNNHFLISFLKKFKI